MSMKRVYVAKGDLALLKEEAEKIGVRPSSLLSYLVEEHFMFVTPENAGLFIELNDLPQEALKVATISDSAYHVAREMCLLCKLRMHTVLTAILRDVLPSLRDFPELFPGLPVLKEMMQKNEANRRSPPVGLDQSVYDAIAQRTRKSDEDTCLGERESVSMYVSTLLDALPTQEFCDAIREVTKEGNLLHLGIFRPAGKQHSVRISADVYALLKELSEEVNIPMSRLLSFLVGRELYDAAEVTVSWEKFRLPDDIRRRWSKVMSEMIAKGRSNRV